MDSDFEIKYDYISVFNLSFEHNDTATYEVEHFDDPINEIDELN